MNAKFFAALTIFGLISISGIVPLAKAQTVANTTITFTNITNGSTDSFFLDNASLVTSASFFPNFSKWGHLPGVERRGHLWSAPAEFQAGHVTGNMRFEGVGVRTIAGSGANNTKFLIGGLNNTDFEWDQTPSTVLTNRGWTNVSPPSAGDTANISKLRSFFNDSSLFITEDGTAAYDIALVMNSSLSGDFDIIWYFYDIDAGDRNMFAGLTTGSAGDSITGPDLTAIGKFLSGGSTYHFCGSGCGGPTPGNVPWSVAWHKGQISRSGSTITFRVDDKIQGTVGSTATFTRFVVRTGASTPGNTHRWHIDGVLTENVTVVPAGNDGNWTSDVRDAGTSGVGQKYSQLRWNSSTTTGGNLTFFARASDTPFGANDSTPAWVQITTQTNLTAPCPCSAGTNLSALTGRYFQTSANFTRTIEEADTNISNLQMILSADDTGTFTINSGENQFINGITNTVVPGTLLSGVNTVSMKTNNTSYWNVTLSLSLGNAVSTITNPNNCFTWKNSSVFANVQSFILTFAKPINTFTGGYNTSAFRNGTLLTSNRTNNTSFDYGVSEDPTTVFVNFSTLNNGTALNVLADFVCLNVTAIDEQTEAKINSFGIVETLVGNPVAKSTTQGFIQYLGTELSQTGTTLTFRVNSTGYQSRDFAFNVPGGGVNRTVGLLLDTSGAFITFTVVDGSGNPQSSVLVLVSVLTTGLLVGQDETDDTGSVRFFLDPAQTYRLSFAKAGFQTLILTVKPTKSQFTIILGQAAENRNLSIAEVSTEYDPPANSILIRPVANVTFLAESVSCSLSNVSIWAKFRGQEQSQINSSPCKATVTVSFNLTAADSINERVEVGTIVNYTDIDGASRFIRDNRTYIPVISANTNQSLFSAIAGGSPGLRNLLSPLGANLAALILSVLIVLLVSIRAPIGNLGSGALFLGVSGFFTLAGMLDSTTMVITAFAVIGIILLRRGGL